jgi:Outer membrane protein beta-barrel domain
MRTIARCAGLVALMLSFATWASAQPASPSDWHHGTTLRGGVGVGTGSSATGPVLSGAIGWEVTPRLGLEGSGDWLALDSRYDGFAGTFAVRYRMAGDRRVDPFVRAGVGMYIASFDGCGVANGGPACDVTQVPRFYRRRWTEVDTAAVGRTFTDPTLVFGGGVSLSVNRHFSVRPDAQGIVVLRGGHSHVVSTFSLLAVFHFEDHPVTPARRP